MASKPQARRQVRMLVRRRGSSCSRRSASSPVGLPSNFVRTKSSFSAPRPYGTPHADSDVDILAAMPVRNQLDQAFKIRLAIPAPFPMDLIVRTPQYVCNGV